MVSKDSKLCFSQRKKAQELADTNTTLSKDSIDESMKYKLDDAVPELGQKAGFFKIMNWMVLLNPRISKFFLAFHK